MMPMRVVGLVVMMMPGGGRVLGIVRVTVGRGRRMHVQVGVVPVFRRGVQV